MTEGTNHIEGGESEQQPPKQLNRRQFLAGLGAVAAASVLGAGEVHAQVPQEIMNGIEDRHTLIIQLSQLTDKDLRDINEGTFTRDEDLYKEVVIGETHNDTSNTGKVMFASALGVGAGMGMARALPPISMDKVVDPKVATLAGGIVGSIAGGVLADHHYSTREKPKMEYRGLLGKILGTYREGGIVITRDTIIGEIQGLEKEVDELEEKRKSYKNKNSSK